jgi:hypothetical protein
MMTAQWTEIVAALSPPLAGPRHPDFLVKILEELVAAGSLVREVDPVTGMSVYREPSEAVDQAVIDRLLPIVDVREGALPAITVRTNGGSLDVEAAGVDLQRNRWFADSSLPDRTYGPSVTGTVWRGAPEPLPPGPELPWIRAESCRAEMDVDLISTDMYAADSLTSPIRALLRFHAF